MVNRCQNLLDPEGGRGKSRSTAPRPASGSKADVTFDSDDSRFARPPANRRNAFGEIKLVGYQQFVVSSITECDTYFQHDAK